MQKDDRKSPCRTEADSGQNDENLFVSQHNAKPLVVGSQSHGTENGNNIWSHPMNIGVPQKNIQHFETVKAYLENCPTDENGNKRMNEQEFVNLMNSFAGCNAQISM